MNKKQKSPNKKIDPLPDDWRLARLGDSEIAQIRGNKKFPNYENVAFISMEYIPDSGTYAKYEVRPRSKIKSFTYCEKGDLLLAKITPSLENGKQGIVPDNVPNGFALATTEVFPISCLRVNSLFLFYILKHSWFRNKIISSMTETTGRQRATKESVEKLLIPFPPLYEQVKIAEILSTVDQAIQKVGKAIEKTQRLKKGLMQQLLTKGIGHKEFKKTDSGMIPKTWELKKLEEISVEFVSGGTPSTSKDEYWNGDIPWMTSAFITEREVKTGQRFITNEGLKKSATRIVPKNNLLVATRVGIGKAAVNRIDIAISQDLTGIIIDNNKAIPDFIYWHIVNSGKRLKSMAQGSTIKRILREDLRKISIPLPPLPEQQKIADILSSVDKRIEALRKRKERLEKVKRGLMEDLLTGSVRVIPLIEKEA